MSGDGGLASLYWPVARPTPTSLQAPSTAASGDAPPPLPARHLTGGHVVQHVVPEPVIGAAHRHGVGVGSATPDTPTGVFDPGRVYSSGLSHPVPVPATGELQPPPPPLPMYYPVPFLYAQPYALSMVPPGVYDPSGGSGQRGRVITVNDSPPPTAVTTSAAPRNDGHGGVASTPAVPPFDFDERLALGVDVGSGDGGARDEHGGGASATAPPKQNVKCSFCDYRTTSHVNVARHERTHTGERPFACTLCSYRSARSDDLAKHIRCGAGGCS